MGNRYVANEYAVVCANPGHFAEFDSPVEVPHDRGTWAELERKGWKVTRDPRFSCNGELVHLCPECTSKYETDV